MKKLRIVHAGVAEASGCDDLAVTPRALAALSAAHRPHLKPVDYLTPADIIEVKGWVTSAVEMMDAEWKARGLLPLLLQAIGFDLCVLLESLKVTDLVLTALWRSGAYSGIQVGQYEPAYPMLEYSRPFDAYADLLRDAGWRAARKVEVESIGDAVGSGGEGAPHRRRLRSYLGIVRQRFRASRRFITGKVMATARRFGVGRFRLPDLIVVPHKDTESLLARKGSVTLDTFLSGLPVNDEAATALREGLESALAEWFAGETPAMERLGLFRQIVRERVLGFIRTRADLVAAYVKARDVTKGHRPPPFLLASSGGCSPDAWVWMAFRENGGVVASAQHGGAYGNLNCPYYIFSDFRFDYFFSYGEPGLSPTYEFAQRHACAKWIAAGSPVLNEVREKQGQPPRTVKKILYVMNLSVSFYSANFPWEHILGQFRTLEILDRFSSDFDIDVKEDQTGAVRRSLYPGLHFISNRPKEVLHKYDLVVLESAMSTVVLEGSATNKFLVVFTGAEWEDVTPASIELLARRAECFHRWDEFHSALERVLEDPLRHLDPAKLNSDEFFATYGNPVSGTQYMETVRRTMSLS